MTCPVPERSPVELRAATPEDWTFVRHSWRASLVDVQLAAAGLDADELRRAREECGCEAECEACARRWSLRDALRKHLEVRHNLRADKAAKRLSCVVAVAPDAPDEVVGYVLLESGREPVVHWAYTKHRLRRLGVGTLLLSAARAQGARCTNHTRAGARLAARFGLRFTPEEES